MSSLPQIFASSEEPYPQESSRSFGVRCPTLAYASQARRPRRMFHDCSMMFHACLSPSAPLLRLGFLPLTPPLCLTFMFGAFLRRLLLSSPPLPLPPFRRRPTRHARGNFLSPVPVDYFAYIATHYSWVSLLLSRPPAHFPGDQGVSASTCFVRRAWFGA